MTSEMGEAFAALRKLKQAKRANNREASAEILRKAGVQFDARGDGVHLIITHRSNRYDFWPGTGLWKTFSGIKGRGVGRLLKHLGVDYEPEKTAV